MLQYSTVPSRVQSPQLNENRPGKVENDTQNCSWSVPGRLIGPPWDALWPRGTKTSKRSLFGDHILDTFVTYVGVCLPTVFYMFSKCVALHLFCPSGIYWHQFWKLLGIILETVWTIGDKVKTTLPCRREHQNPGLKGMHFLVFNDLYTLFCWASLFQDLLHAFVTFCWFMGAFGLHFWHNIATILTRTFGPQKNEKSGSPGHPESGASATHLR